MHKNATNPFTFGDLALDEAFTDREDEVRELASDMRNGQNVLIYAPRRYGKSSLVLRAAQEALRRKALVGYCDLMKIPNKERLAAALAKTIYADIASPVGQAFERAAELFRSLRVRPTMEVDPGDGALRFSFQPGRRKSDIDETIERLLELLGELAAERKRRVVMIFDEFQEILSLDPKFPNLMRAVFQTQPEVSHVYLGSKRHILERIFNDKNEPFWRSAKQLELGMIPPAKFGPFIGDQFAASGKGITPEGLERLLATSGGHPYGTQELAYFVWELIPPGADASIADIETAVSRVLRSENNHFAQLWDEAPHAQRLLMLALADDPTSSIYSADYHERHELPANPTLQTALAGLIRKEIAGRDADGEYRVIEPFLAEWLMHEQRDYVSVELTRSKPPDGARLVTAQSERAPPEAESLTQMDLRPHAAASRSASGEAATGRFRGQRDNPDREPVPNDSHEERRGLQHCCDPRDKDRRLRRLSLSTSLALGQVDAATQLTVALSIPHLRVTERP